MYESFAYFFAKSETVFSADSEVISINLYFLQGKLTHEILDLNDIFVLRVSPRQRRPGRSFWKKIENAQ